MLRHLLLAALAMTGLAGFARPDGADTAAVERLVRQLGSDQFHEREAAMKALDALGEAALPALRKAEGDNDPEVRRCVRRLDEAIRLRLRAEALAAIKRLGGSVRARGSDRASWFDSHPGSGRHCFRSPTGCGRSYLPSFLRSASSSS